MFICGSLSQVLQADETGLRVPGAGGGVARPPHPERRRLRTGAAPPASENKRDIQQGPLAASNSLGIGIVESGCTVIAFKSSRTPPAARTWVAPRPRACVSPVSAGREPGRSRRALRRAAARSVSTGHERRGHLGCAWPAAGGPAVGAAAPGEVTRPALSPSSLALSLQPRAQLYSVRFGRPGTQPWAVPRPGSRRGAPAAPIPGRRRPLGWPGHHVARASSDQCLPSRMEALGPKSVDLGLLLLFPGAKDLIKPSGELELPESLSGSLKLNL